MSLRPFKSGLTFFIAMRLENRVLPLSFAGAHAARTPLFRGYSPSNHQRFLYIIASIPRVQKAALPARA